MKKKITEYLGQRAFSRRDFLKKTSLGTLALVAAGRIQQPLLQKMVDTAVIAFSGENTLTDAWSKYFSADDVVGLKVNALGLQDLQGMYFLQHFTAVTTAIAIGLKKAGVKEENVIVWDRSEEELGQAGFIINQKPTAMRVKGNKRRRRGSGSGFNPKSYPVGKSSSRVSSILADLCTAMINIPVPKTHGSAVFTGSLKNHYGTIDNPGDFHSNSCTNPGIPEVNTIPMIRDKQKLIVCDAMLVAIEDGPR
jgi:hypothetical protein